VPALVCGAGGSNGHAGSIACGLHQSRRAEAPRVRCARRRLLLPVSNGASGELAKQFSQELQLGPSSASSCDCSLRVEAVSSARTAERVQSVRRSWAGAQAAMQPTPAGIGLSGRARSRLRRASFTAARLASAVNRARHRARVFDQRQPSGGHDGLERHRSPTFAHSQPAFFAPPGPELARRQVDHEPNRSTAVWLLGKVAQKRTLEWGFTAELVGSGKTGRWRERRARRKP
jgi:hypothetical protein